MEAKLAEYRARKIKEQRQKDTVFARFVSFFRRKGTGSTDSEKKEDDSKTGDKSTSQHQSQDFTDTSLCDTEETDIESLPQKYSWLLFTLKIALWLTVWLIFIEIQFGAVFFTISALVFVYINTRTGRKRQKDSMSAYSVFNPNCERLQGTITAEQFEAELLHRKPLAQS